MSGSAGSRDGAVVSVLASHRCVPGSVPGHGVICGLTFVVGSPLCSERFPPGTPVSPISLKTRHFQIPIRLWNARTFLKRVLVKILGAPWVNKLHFYDSQSSVRLVLHLRAKETGRAIVTFDGYNEISAKL